MIRIIMFQTLKLVLLGLCVGWCVPLQAQVTQQDSIPSRSFDWSPELIAIAEGLPIQHGGRVKPLRTWADFKLLALSSGRKVKIEQEGETVKIDAVAWVLDCMFFPELAMTYPVLICDDTSVLRAVGMDLEDHGRRDRFSLQELQGVTVRLMQSAQRIQAMDEGERAREETQTLDFALRLRTLQGLHRLLAPVRAEISAPPGSAVEEWAVAGKLNLVTVLANLEGVREALQSAGEDGQRVASDLGEALEAASLSGSSELSLVPPAGTRTDDEEWLDLGEALAAILTEDHTTSREVLVALRTAQDAATAGHVDDLQVALVRLVEVTSRRAEARGELRSVASEVSFRNAGLFTWALVLFIVAFLSGVLALLPGTRWLGWSTWGSLAGGAGALLIGISWRCWINERPPITTLYETAPFIGVCGVLLSMGVARIQRQRALLPLGAVFGVAIMFLALRLEQLDAVSTGDSIKNLAAVLDTNFWLSTHVTTITFGYCAGLFAWALAATWVLALPLVRARRTRHGASAAGWHRALTRSIYGVVAFGLMFSLVGTILGGIWANYSWGRFWGWDPKENGALVIVLWQLVILHARQGGLIKDLGLALTTVALGSVVVFSWFGVNQLGVGLHSYGFTTGAATAMTIWHSLNLALILWGLAWWFVAYMKGSSSGKGAA